MQGGAPVLSKEVEKERHFYFSTAIEKKCINDINIFVAC
jgi:hypothetical protein